MLHTIYNNANWGLLQQSKENGVAEVFVLSSDNGEIEYPFIVREAGIVDGQMFYDIVTPRGECGPILKTLHCDELFNEFDKKFQSYCNDNKIIAEYVRFDPWNDLTDKFKNIYNIRSHGNVYCNDLSKDCFTTQYSSKRRNQVRKALNSGVKTVFSDNDDYLETFIKLYEYTEKKYDVSNYYKLSLQFLKQYFNMLKGSVIIGIAFYNDEPITAAMFLNGGDVFHYHFSASNPEFADVNALSLLLYEATKNGAELGCNIMDLGSAILNSGLEKFKKSFVNNDGILPCFVGTKVRNKRVYDELVKVYENPVQGYFPKYRR